MTAWRCPWRPQPAVTVESADCEWVVSVLVGTAMPGSSRSSTLEIGGGQTARSRLRSASVANSSASLGGAGPAYSQVIVPCVFAQRAELGGDREINVLTVRGDPGVERRRGGVDWFWHRLIFSV